MILKDLQPEVTKHQLEQLCSRLLDSQFATEEEMVYQLRRAMVQSGKDLTETRVEIGGDHQGYGSASGAADGVHLAEMSERVEKLGVWGIHILFEKLVSDLFLTQCSECSPDFPQIPTVHRKHSSRLIVPPIEEAADKRGTYGTVNSFKQWMWPNPVSAVQPECSCDQLCPPTSVALFSAGRRPTKTRPFQLQTVKSLPEIPLHFSLAGHF
jgi:hypothetical protein